MEIRSWIILRAREGLGPCCWDQTVGGNQMIGEESFDAVMRKLVSFERDTQFLAVASLMGLRSQRKFRLASRLVKSSGLEWVG
jgi:hypothetical protein